MEHFPNGSPVYQFKNETIFALGFASSRIGFKRKKLLKTQIKDSGKPQEQDLMVECGTPHPAREKQAEKGSRFVFEHIDLLEVCFFKKPDSYATGPH